MHRYSWLGVKSLFMAGTVAIAAIAPATVGDAEERRAVRPDLAQIRVMTRNLYDGIDYLDPAVRDCHQLRETLAAIIKSGPDIQARAALHASQIAGEHPDLIAIQEAITAQTDGKPQVNMLADLVNDLDKLGKPYEKIVAMTGLDTGNVDIGGGHTSGFAVWDAILVRSDLPRLLYDEDGGFYKLSLNVTIPIAYAPDDLAQPCVNDSNRQQYANMNFRRNWMFVDMQLRGHSFRFVNTHLDYFPDNPAPARLQAAELMAIMGNTRLPVIVAGDFNYPYEDFGPGKDFSGLAVAGYRDAWIEGNGSDVNSPGLLKATCCQANTWGSYPKDLPWTRTEKVDLILLRGGVSAISANLVGAVSPPCFPQGCTVLASDHAGVVAGLVFTSAMTFDLVSLLVAIGGILFFAGLLLGVSWWRRRESK